MIDESEFRRVIGHFASGVAVVNIDNGFGAGFAASQINALVSQTK